MWGLAFYSDVESTCGQHHYIKWDWAHKTSLAPPLFIEVPVPFHERLRVSIFAYFYGFHVWSWNCDMLCFSFYYHILLQYADGEDFTLSHMNAFDNACEDTLFRNISNYHHDNNGELVLMPGIVTVGCPNNCNRQGRCLHGACICNHGFTSVDCSVPVGSSPVIDHITG